MGVGVDFGAVFDAAPNAYMIVDRAFRYVAVNAAYLAVTHRRREELIGRRLMDVFPHDPNNLTNDPARRLRTSFDQVLSTGKPDVLPYIHYRILVRPPDGNGYEDHYWSATHTPLFGARGEVAYILQHTVNVTELHRRKLALDAAVTSPLGAQVAASVLGRAEAVQEKNLALGRAHAVDVVEREREHVARTLAEQANELKDQFLATVSHELRTPLTAMLGWLSMLRSGKLTPEKEANALAVVERNARVQTQLVDDLLDVSRIASGKLDLDVKRVDLGAVIDAAVETVRPAADAGGVRLEIDASSAGAVDGDGRRLLQVIWNLLSNAVKFTPRDGLVALKAARRRDAVEIVVSDTGVGIPSEFLPHVFERFQQSESSGARNRGGLGLGLSIVEHVVKAHRGDVGLRRRQASSGRNRSHRAATGELTACAAQTPRLGTAATRSLSVGSRRLHRAARPRAGIDPRSRHLRQRTADADRRRRREHLLGDD